MVEELLVYGNHTVNFQRLELRLQERRAVDLENLRKAFEYLASLTWPNSVQLTIAPNEKLASLKAEIDALQKLLASEPGASVGPALDFRIGGTLLHLVLAAIKCEFSLHPLLELVRPKISLLDKQQVVQLWSYVQEEFDAERDTHMEAVPGVLPDNFLKFEREGKARENLARYIVEWKPRLMLALHDRRGPGYPMEVPSLSTVLAWRASSTVDAPSLAEIRLTE